MFAAALDRADAIRELLAHGADPARTSKPVDLTGVTAPEETLQNTIRDAQNAKSASVSGAPRPRGRAAGAAASRGVAGVTRSFAFNELIGTQGGLTALHFAARQGSARSVQALVEHGANVNALSPGDRVSPLLIAAVNGQFDIAKYLLAHGADPNLANAGGVTPLYAVLNIEWAPRMFYPQPRAQLQQETSYLDLMTLLLDKGADPNARLVAQDLVHAVQLRSAPRRRWRRDAVLARGLRERHRRDEAAAEVRRRSDDRHDQAVLAAARHRRRPRRAAGGRLGTAAADRRTRHPAAARRGRRRLRRRVRRQRASLRADRHARRGEVPGRGSARRRQRARSRGQHRAAQRRRRAATTR